MALLFRCLQELRVRQGEPLPLAPAYPAGQRARDSWAVFAAGPTERLPEPSAYHADSVGFEAFARGQRGSGMSPAGNDGA